MWACGHHTNFSVKCLLGRWLQFIPHGFHFSSLSHPALPWWLLHLSQPLLPPSTPCFSLHFSTVFSLPLAESACPPAQPYLGFAFPCAHVYSLAGVLRCTQFPPCPCLVWKPPSVSSLLSLCFPQLLKASFGGCLHHCLPAILQLRVPWGSLAVSVPRRKS